jgi:hypothetical protein
MIDPALLSCIQNAVCAIGCLCIPEEEFRQSPDRLGAFHIEGTGFLVTDRTVLTNRHVITRLMQFAGNRGISEQNYFLQFNYCVARGHHQQGWCRFGHYGVVGNTTFDVGLINFMRLPDPDFAQCQPVHFVDTFDVSIGDEVGCLGYSHGAPALERDAGDSME